MDDPLHAAAYELASEMRADLRWRDAMSLPGDTEATAELRKRRPGYSDDDYGRALAAGFAGSR